MAAKKKTPTKKKIVRNEERENRMLKLFQMWEHGDQEAYEQLLKIAREEDWELTKSDFVHPYDTDNFVAENFFHLENMQQKPFDCILEPGLSLEGVYFYVYMPVERVYSVFFKDGSDLRFFQDSWEIYASLREALEDMGRDD